MSRGAGEAFVAEVVVGPAITPEPFLAPTGTTQVGTVGLPFLFVVKQELATRRFYQMFQPYTRSTATSIKP